MNRASKREIPERLRMLLAAAAILGLLVMPIGLASAGGGPEGVTTPGQPGGAVVGGVVVVGVGGAPSPWSPPWASACRISSAIRLMCCW